MAVFSCILQGWIGFLVWVFGCGSLVATARYRKKRCKKQERLSIPCAPIDHRLFKRFIGRIERLVGAVAPGSIVGLFASAKVNGLGFFRLKHNRPKLASFLIVIAIAKRLSFRHATAAPRIFLASFNIDCNRRVAGTYWIVPYQTPFPGYWLSPIIAVGCGLAKPVSFDPEFAGRKSSRQQFPGINSRDGFQLDQHKTGSRRVMARETLQVHVKKG